DACRFPAVQNTSAAHVAFTDHSALRVELRHAIRAIPHTVLTSDACIGGMQHNAGHRILRISIDRAAEQAIGAEAVIASHREIGAMGIRVRAAFEFTESAPLDLGRVSVLLVARDLTGAAADTLRHVEVKSILFARLKRPIGNQWRRSGKTGSTLIKCEAHE